MLRMTKAQSRACSAGQAAWARAQHCCMARAAATRDNSNGAHLMMLFRFCLNRRKRRPSCAAERGGKTIGHVDSYLVGL